MKKTLEQALYVYIKDFRFFLQKCFDLCTDDLSHQTVSTKHHLVGKNKTVGSTGYEYKTV